MADRYQDGPYPADEAYDRGDDPHHPSRIESDPLAELARLIGQTDPFANMGRANAKVQPRSPARDSYEHPMETEDDVVPAGPPPWMQRANRQQAAVSRNLVQPEAATDEWAPQQDFSNTEHPLRRYAAQHAAPEPEYDPQPAHAEEPLDPARYDEALYGRLESEAQQVGHDPAYSDDPYGYQNEYGEGAGDQPRKRRGGLTTVVMVLALAVVGTGGAFAYRTFLGSHRTGEPPIIKADNSPTKIVPASADANSKLPDRLTAGDGKEKIVPREEAPVDVNANAQGGPRMVFPPLNQNANPPTVASVTPSGPPPATTAGNGTMSSSEPHKIKTFSVRGDQSDASGAPSTMTQSPTARAGATRGAPRPNSAANANASSANAPLSLSPQAAPVAEPRTRVAANAPAPVASTGGGGYVVQVSSQKNEADAQVSYRVLQGKFPSVLGSRAPLIKRADLGDKGVYYRAMVGPFGTPEEASQLCGNLKTAGGQCVVQRN